MTNENGEDGVEAGIREWRRTKADAEAAIEKCRVAEQDATFVRGQMEVLAAQKKADDAKIRTLEAHVAEMELYVGFLFDAISKIKERREAGIFRGAGSVRDGGDRIREAPNGGEGRSEGHHPEPAAAGPEVPVAEAKSDYVDDGEPIPQFLGPKPLAGRFEPEVSPADQLERDIAQLHGRRRGKRE